MCGAVDPDTGAVCDVESGHITHRAFTEAGQVVTWERDPTEYENPEVDDDEFTDIAREVGRAKRARARRTDPETSHEAAASLGDLTDAQREVWELLRDGGPMWDERLVEVAPGHGITQTPQGLRSRRSELVDAGLVEWTGAYEQTSRGQRTRVWRAVRPDTSS